jgi:TolB-like protein
MKRASFLVGLAVLALGASRTEAQGKPTVAVIPYVNSAIGKSNEELAPLSKGIQDLMGVELAANTGIKLVDRDNLQTVIAEQNMSRDGRVDAASIVKLGKLTGAHHFITGTFITNTKGEMVLTSKVFNGETGEIEFSTSDKDRTDNFMTLVTKVAHKLNAGMKLPDMPKQVGEAREKKAEKVPFAAVMLYSRAITAKDAGNKADAVTLFRQAIQKFPDYDEAKAALAKVEGK